MVFLVSFLGQMDTSCLIAAILFTGSHLLTLLSRLQHGKHFDYEKLRSLDPDYIQESFEQRNSQTQWEITTGLLNAAGWFVFCLPILQAAWYLSSRGTRNVPTTIAIAAMALGGSFAEMLAQVMYLGITNTTNWVSGSFTLDGWTSSGDGETDSVGVRTVEVVHTILRGLLLWVDAMEWFFLFGIMTLMFMAVHVSESHFWNRKWAVLGLVIGILSVLDFAANVLRFQSWRLFGRIAFYLSCGTRLILLPIWLGWLGRILYKINSGKVDSPSARTPAPEAEMTDRSAGSLTVPNDADFI